MINEELLKTYFQNKHILQSKEWGKFKTLMGTKAITIDPSTPLGTSKLQVTIHKIPFTPWKVGYAPKVRPEDLDLDELYEIGRKENCLFVKIDVPHAPHEFKVESYKFKIARGKSVFAQSTILLDLTKSDDELLAAMHEKTRYNIGLARRKGVEVEIFDPTRSHLVDGAVERFTDLQKQTAKRQKFFLHPDIYYQKCFEILSQHKMAFLLEAKVEDETAASWMLFKYGDVLYYPYGESNHELRSYMGSNLLMWEAIQLGKKLGCKVFDLWGAAENPEDENDPWHGFTRFKLSFSGLHVKLAPTYDLVINPTLYSLFNLADNLRWRTLRFLRR